MKGLHLAELHNRRAVPLASVPEEKVDDFLGTVADASHSGWRLAALFGAPEDDTHTRLVAILAHDTRGRLGATSAVVGEAYPSLTPECPRAARFEREIFEQCGVRPEGHPRLAPVRRHAPDHLPRGRSAPAGALDAFDLPPVGGDAHEVAVGPVHAGIIEPGHFRFQLHGEEVLRLDIVLGYQHRGVEWLLESEGAARGVAVAESIAGDTVVGHAEAYCGALEALGRSRKSARSQVIRSVALELERLANHVGDLGAMAGDVAYQPGAAYLGGLRGECLNLLLEISGNRFGRGLVRPGGTQFDISPAQAESMLARLERLSRDLRPVLDLVFENPTVQGRFERVGTLTREDCQRLGVVGPAARACEVDLDARQNHPYGAYRFSHVPVAMAWTGDVMGRALVRRIEIERSLEFVREQLTRLPRGECRVPCGRLQPEEMVVVLTEAWRGEVVHVALTDADGALRRYKVVDPSFHNWDALAAVLPGNQLSDFPLCNKSFNLSYAGHDL